jgi:hypothetical protein
MRDTINKQALLDRIAQLKVSGVSHETHYGLNLIEHEVKSGALDSPYDQGEVQRLRSALVEIKRLVTESKGRIWTGVGIIEQVDAALSTSTEPDKESES